MRFVARRPYFKLLDVVDEELLESPGQHVLCLLVAPLTYAGHHDLALESSGHPISHASGFLPVALNFDISA